MYIRLVTTAVILGLLSVPAVAGEPGDAAAVVDGVLNSFHEAASEADGELYFSLFAEGAVFMGTDVRERWTVDELKAYAEPHFSQGRGWTYHSRERHISLSPGRKTAWFDEVLWNQKYGTCRGTGVLILTENGWRIAQYQLTFPIPDELTVEITSRIKEHEDAGGSKNK